MCYAKIDCNFVYQIVSTFERVECWLSWVNERKGEKGEKKLAWNASKYQMIMTDQRDDASWMSFMLFFSFILLWMRLLRTFRSHCLYVWCLSISIVVMQISWYLIKNLKLILIHSECFAVCTSTYNIHSSAP